MVAEHNHSAPRWMDVLWILFLVGLALLPPVEEVQKQVVLLAFGVFQLLESRIIATSPRMGREAAVLIKVLLATLLMMHTSTAGINSGYYPIYFLPVVTAAIYFGPWATLLWTIVASAAFCSLLIPALREGYYLPASGLYELGLRILFLFIAGMVVNRFAYENRRQSQRYQQLAETLAETNRRLENAEAEARRSERLAALGQLSAGLAHEIRNPLGVIKGSAEMLNQKLKDSSPLAAELAGNISSEVNRLSALVARFMNFARPSRLELHRHDIVSLVDRALAAVRNQYPEAKVTVERDYADGLPQLLLDEGLCEEVFINLALNAYEAMEPGGGTLHVRIAPATLDGRRGVDVNLEDSGPGVPPELREQIFNPFVTTKRTGAGLGLSIVSKIVDDHRGSIRVTGEPGHGARFSVFFPEAE